MNTAYEGKIPTKKLAAMVASPSSSTWYTDSGASNHITADLANLAIQEEYNGSDKVAVGNGSDSMKPANVGLAPDMPYFKTVETEETPPITYLHIYECDKFSIGIFCLPPSGVIPLHNHPGMTVFSKLLFGSMNIKSYDWVADIPSSTNNSLGSRCVPPPGFRLAKVHIDTDFTAPCNTSILYPAAGGNMHCFTALTSCAVLDVLGPPYNDSEGRHCAYYNDFPYAKFLGDMVALPADEALLEDEEGYVWLEEREKPEKFVVVGDLYRGPKIVKT